MEEEKKEEIMFLANSRTFREIAEESYREMKKEMAERINGNCIRFVPGRKSFKHACITIVFTAAWIESLTYQYIMAIHGNEEFQKHDRERMDERLNFLGIKDESLLCKVKELREDRIEILHEKALYGYPRDNRATLKPYVRNGKKEQTDTRIMQKCAENAYNIIQKLPPMLDNIWNST